MIQRFLVLSLLLSGGIAVGISLVSRQVSADDDLLKILGGEQTEVKQSGSDLVTRLKLVPGLQGPEAPVFLSLVASDNLQRAFFLWPVAFAGTPFATSANGRALYAWLLFKNGLAVNGLESLMEIDEMSAIAPEILSLWKEAVTDQHPAWMAINPRLWKTQWASVFGVGTEVRVASLDAYGAEQIDAIKELIKKTSVGSQARALLQWQLALALADRDQSGDAAKVLSLLSKDPQRPVADDLLSITIARLLYQNGYLEPAIQFDSKIPKTSDHWVEAQEEMAWAELRLGRAQNALAVTMTLTNPLFIDQVGAEVFFLRALAQLKVCDYPAVAATLKAFSERFRARTERLTVFAGNTEVPEATRLRERLRANTPTLNELGKDVRVLPRFVTRDFVLSGLVRAETTLRAEGARADDLFLRAMNDEGMQPGAQAHLDSAKKAVVARARAASNAVNARLKSLATEELAEIAATLKKMQIVEAEVIQQVALAGKKIAASQTTKPTVKTGTTGSQARDRLWFPLENEIWLDELANIKVDLKKGCEARAATTIKKVEAL